MKGKGDARAATPSSSTRAIIKQARRVAWYELVGRSPQNPPDAAKRRRHTVDASPRHLRPAAALDLERRVVRVHQPERRRETPILNVDERSYGPQGLAQPDRHRHAGADHPWPGPHLRKDRVFVTALGPTPRCTRTRRIWGTCGGALWAVTGKAHSNRRAGSAPAEPATPIALDHWRRLGCAPPEWSTLRHAKPAPPHRPARRRAADDGCRAGPDRPG